MSTEIDTFQALLDGVSSIFRFMTNNVGLYWVECGQYQSLRQEAETIDKFIFIGVTRGFKTYRTYGKHFRIGT